MNELIRQALKTKFPQEVYYQIVTTYPELITQDTISTSFGFALVSLILLIPMVLLGLAIKRCWKDFGENLVGFTILLVLVTCPFMFCVHESIAYRLYPNLQIMKQIECQHHQLLKDKFKAETGVE